MRRRTLLAATGAAAVVSMLPGALPVAAPPNSPTRRLAIYRRAAALLARHPGLRVGQALFWAAYADGVVSRCEALFAFSPYFDDQKVAAFDRWLERRLPDEPALAQAPSV